MTVPSRHVLIALAPLCGAAAFGIGFGIAGLDGPERAGTSPLLVLGILAAVAIVALAASAEEAVDFIETAPPEQPVFTYFAPYAPHYPFDPGPYAGSTRAAGLLDDVIHAAAGDEGARSFLRGRDDVTRVELAGLADGRDLDIRA